MNFNIREYGTKDKNDLEKLVIYLQNFERALEPDILHRGETIAKEYVSNLLKNVNTKSGRIYLAKVGKETVGFVAGNVEESRDEIELLDKKYFYISDLVVFPEFQGMGIGKALLTEIEKFAGKQNVRQLGINVLSRNINAYEIYKKQGFRDYENILVKEL